MTTITQDLRSPEELADYLIISAGQISRAQHIAAAKHRQNLIRIWGIHPGARILEIGSGHGEFTAAAADATGPSGRVIALEPAPQHGTPPIVEAQSCLKDSPLGLRIEFVMTDGISYLKDFKDDDEPFDYIVICHSLWYFENYTVLDEIMKLAVGKTKALCVAEFNLSANPARFEAVPHLLTVLATNTFQSLTKSPMGNIHCALSPKQVITTAKAHGWTLRRQDPALRVPDEERSGWRETSMALHPFTANAVRNMDASEEVKTMLLGMRDALASTVNMLRGGLDDVLDMDVWAGRFELLGATSAP